MFPVFTFSQPTLLLTNERPNCSLLTTITILSDKLQIYFQLIFFPSADISDFSLSNYGQFKPHLSPPDSIYDTFWTFILVNSNPSL